jgi:hypothetical protein
MATRGAKRAKADAVLPNVPGPTAREQKLEVALRACLALRKAVIDNSPEHNSEWLVIPRATVQAFDREWQRVKELP